MGWDEKKRGKQKFKKTSIMGKGVGALKKGGGCDLLQVDSTTTEFLKKRKKKKTQIFRASFL